MHTQSTSVDESSSQKREAFFQMIETFPSQTRYGPILKTAWIETPLGSMITIADDKALYFLGFFCSRAVERQIQYLKKKTRSAMILGYTNPIYAIEEELQSYFTGSLKEFKTPLFLLGTAFQKEVWQVLKNIPYGKTLSYSELASAVGNPSACRAVAQANGTNQFSIVIPCHRVINKDGQIGGYGGGIGRKKWLLDHEKQRE